LPAVLIVGKLQAGSRIWSLNVMLLPVTAGPFGVNIVTTISCVLASAAAVVVAYWVIVICLEERSVGIVTLPP
jgi:hypothetical protein